MTSNSKTTGRVWTPDLTRWAILGLAAGVSVLIAGSFVERCFAGGVLTHFYALSLPSLVLLASCDARVLRTTFESGKPSFQRRFGFGVISSFPLARTNPARLRGGDRFCLVQCAPYQTALAKIFDVKRLEHDLETHPLQGCLSFCVHPSPRSSTPGRCGEDAQVVGEVRLTFPALPRVPGCRYTGGPGRGLRQPVRWAISSPSHASSSILP